MSDMCTRKVGGYGVLCDSGKMSCIGSSEKLLAGGSLPADADRHCVAQAYLVTSGITKIVPVQRANALLPLTPSILSAPLYCREAFREAKNSKLMYAARTQNYDEQFYNRRTIYLCIA